jgi:hypothetical protein
MFTVTGTSHPTKFIMYSYKRGACYTFGQFYSSLFSYPIKAYTVKSSNLEASHYVIYSIPHLILFLKRCTWTWLSSYELVMYQSCYVEIYFFLKRKYVICSVWVRKVINKNTFVWASHCMNIKARHFQAIWNREKETNENRNKCSCTVRMSEYSYETKMYYASAWYYMDRLCGLVIRVLDYRSRGPGFDSRAL